MLQIRMLTFHGTMIPMNSGSFRLQIVVLAAGFSSRLGQPKALARVHGASLLGRALQTAQGLGAAALIAVIPPNAAQYRIMARGMKVLWAANPRRAEGLSSSVRRGILAARYASAILLIPADLVNLKHRDLARLVRRWQSAPRRVIARRAGRGGAIPVILPRWLYPRALKVVGDIGLRELIEQLAPEQRVLVELGSAAQDVDTPQALNEVRRRFRPRG
jgi:molybdenum cofactor cytidylyltransferase